MIRTILRRALAAAVTGLIATSAGAETGVERPLTLRAAIDLALQKNESLASNRESYSASEAAAGATRGAYDPVLAWNSTWQRSSQPTNLAYSTTTAARLAGEAKSAETGLTLSQLLPAGGSLALRAEGSRQTSTGGFVWYSPAYDTRVGVELRQPLLRNRNIDEARFSMRVADADHQGAGAELRRSQIETVAAVERAYWSLVAARLVVGVGEQSVRLAEDQLSETRIRIQTGTVPHTELAQPLAELERRRGELLAAQEAVTRAENTLKLNMLGDEDGDLWAAHFSPIDSVAVAPTAVDVSSALERALASRPELEEAVAETRHRKAETAFAKNEVHPSLDAVVAYDRYGLAGVHSLAAPGVSLPSQFADGLGGSFDALGSGDYDGFRVGLVLGLPIGNRSARGNAEAAEHAEHAADAQLAQVRNAIRAEVLDAAAALETARERIDVERSSREAAETQFDTERDRYASGLSTNFLVLTRQNDLSRARLNEIAALTDYRMARTEIARATGTLLQDRGISVENAGGSK